MNDQENEGRCSEARDYEIRAALDQHWAAADANELETEHHIYHNDAVLEYPQSGEQPGVGAAHRINAQVSRAQNGSPSDESLAAVIWIGSNNTYPDAVAM